MIVSSMDIPVRQLMYQSPTLIAYGIGVVLALVNWGRFPRPSMFLLFGSILLLGSSLAQPLLQSMSYRSSIGGYNAISLGFTVVRAAGFGLVLAAVVSGRGRAEEQFGGSGFQVMRPPPPMMPPPGPRA